MLDRRSRYDVHVIQARGTRGASVHYVTDPNVLNLRRELPSYLTIDFRIPFVRIAEQCELPGWKICQNCFYLPDFWLERCYFHVEPVGSQLLEIFQVAADKDSCRLFSDRRYRAVAGYEQGRPQNLERLHAQVHLGRGRPQPDGRVCIAKTDSGQRSLGAIAQDAKEWFAFCGYPLH